MDRKWWKEAVGYEIYPKSFFDSNNDGIGDLNGIKEKLDYLQDLGINLLWICPIYDSPMDDNGYDISDYYNVNPMFGSIDDMKLLIQEAKKRDIHIILDFIMNHTSDEHEWFKEARKSKNNPFHDYYIWADPKNGGVPNNWSSFFSDSCWEYNEQTDEYYMHIFSNKMPDLNWRNRELRSKLYDVARFWLDLGIDGFRLDAINHIDKDWSFSDSTMETKGFYKPDWSKFSDQPRVKEHLQEFRREVLDGTEAFAVGELGGGTHIDIIKEYTTAGNGMLDMVFTFDHCFANNVLSSLENGWKKEIDVVHLKRTFKKYQDRLYEGSWNPLSWLNHDHPRVLSHYGSSNYHYESGSMLATLILSIHGTPFVYNGEEIGMMNNDFRSLDEYQDVFTINKIANAKRSGYRVRNIERFARLTSRDNARTPFQWNDSKYAGFSTVEPWMKVNDNYRYINVEAQLKEEKTLLKYYRKMIHLRRFGDIKEIMIYGKFELLDEENPDVFAFKQTLEDISIVVIANFREYECNFHLGDETQQVISNYDDFIFEGNNVKLRPYEAMILKRND